MLIINKICRVYKLWALFIATFVKNPSQARLLWRDTKMKLWNVATVDIPSAQKTWKSTNANSSLSSLSRKVSCATSSLKQENAPVNIAITATMLRHSSLARRSLDLASRTSTLLALRLVAREELPARDLTTKSGWLASKRLLESARSTSLEETVKRKDVSLDMHA